MWMQTIESAHISWNNNFSLPWCLSEQLARYSKAACSWACWTKFQHDPRNHRRIWRHLSTVHRASNWRYFWGIGQFVWYSHCHKSPERVSQFLQRQLWHLFLLPQWPVSRWKLGCHERCRIGQEPAVMIVYLCERSFRMLFEESQIFVMRGFFGSTVESQITKTWNKIHGH